MISKELLSAVYPIDETTETYVGIQESTGRVMWFGKEYNDCRSEIDIHRVAHKCKEWAKYDKLFGNSGYDLYTEHHRGTNYPSAMGEKPLNKNYNHYICFYNRHNIASSTIGQGITEPEAIFKACEWILTKDSK